MKKNFAVLALVFLGACALLMILHMHKMKEPTFIFINETEDHRFDESIQVSIMAATQRTGVQNAVVITNRFRSGELTTQAPKIFREWGLGRSRNGRAILYLYSPATRELKIEVGYALEGILPDLQIHFLERAAKTFTFADRAQDFWAELINTINIHIQSQSDNAGDLRNFRFLSGGAGIEAHDYSTDTRQLKTEMNAENLQGFDPDVSWEITFSRYLQSLRSGVGAENVLLLSTDAQRFRRFTPMTISQTKRNASMIDKAGVSKVVREDGWAFVFFGPKYPVLPVILRRLNGLWYVDEPLAWSLFQRFENSNRVFLKYPLKFVENENAKWLEDAFGEPLYANPKLEISKLNSLSGWQRDYFRSYDLDQVVKTFSQPIAQISDEQIWVAIDVAQNLGRFSRFLELVDEAVRRFPQSSTWKTNLDFYRKTLVFDGGQWLRTWPSEQKITLPWINMSR